MKSVPNKDDVLTKLRKLEAQHAPAQIGQDLFEKLSGISRYQWQQATAMVRWSDVRAAAGLSALEWSPRKDKAIALELISAEIKRSGKVPIWEEIRFLRKKNPALPTITTLRAWFKTKNAFLEALAAHAETNPDYQGNLGLLRAVLANLPVPAQAGMGALVDTQPTLLETLSEDFVPPVIRSLPLIASGDGAMRSQAEAAGRSLEREMERRTAIALRLLGLEVEEKARPGKEEADGVAIGRLGLESWGLIYDAKTKENGGSYRISVDERRKFESYIRLHSPKLTGRGCRRVHLIIVASAFEEKDTQTALDIRLASGQAAQSVCLLTADGLVALVNQKLRGNIGLEQVERVLATSSIVR